jgi:hypothetical protein
MQLGRRFPLPDRAGYQPVARRFHFREPFQSCAADRTVKLIGLARSHIEFGPLIKRAAGANHLGSCHSGRRAGPPKVPANGQPIGTIAGLELLEWSGAHRRRGPPDPNGPSLPPARWGRFFGL